MANVHTQRRSLKTTESFCPRWGPRAHVRRCPGLQYFICRLWAMQAHNAHRHSPWVGADLFRVSNLSVSRWPKIGYWPERPRSASSIYQQEDEASREEGIGAPGQCSQHCHGWELGNALPVNGGSSVDIPNSRRLNAAGMTELPLRAKLTVDTLASTVL